MKAGKSNLLVALGLHYALHVTWVGASTRVAKDRGSVAYAKQGNSRAELGTDSVGERFPNKKQDGRRVQATELLTGKGLALTCPEN